MLVDEAVIVPINMTPIQMTNDRPIHRLITSMADKYTLKFTNGRPV